MCGPCVELRLLCQTFKMLQTLLCELRNSSVQNSSVQQNLKIFKFCNLQVLLEVPQKLSGILRLWKRPASCKPTQGHTAATEKDSNTTSIFSSILYGLVSTVQAALINITACSSYPCNSYFQNWNSTCAEIANIFFCSGNKTKILFMLWAHCSQPLYLSVKIMVSPLPPLWKIICFAISWY